jgi:hypothetical protein
MAALTEFSQSSETLVQYADKACQLRDDFEALDMKASLALLSQSFITGLSDELRIACGPSLQTTILTCNRKKS